MFTRITRRDFFKRAGVLASAVALTGCGGDRAEQRLVPFLRAPEDQVAGTFTPFASLCRQCPAGCGILVQTMGGRAHKIEGNPRHPLNQGRLCARGQAGLQVLYNPDRLTGPQARAGGRQSAFGSVTWDDALGRLTEALGEALQGGTGSVEIMGGQLPDHLYRIATLLFGTGGDGREPVVWNAARGVEGRVLLEEAAEEVFGVRRLPLFDMGTADVVVSFSANLLETWLSPVFYGRSYGSLRSSEPGGRGQFFQVEPRLSSTGASADQWLAVPPERESDLARAVGRLILDEGLAFPGRPSGVDEFFADVDARAMAIDMGLSFETVVRLARLLGGADAPLAVPGGGLSGYAGARRHIRTVLALNLLVGAHETTLRPSAGPPGVAVGPDPSPAGEGAPFEPTEKVASFSRVKELVDRMNGGEVSMLLVLDGDPVFDLPPALGFAEAASNVPLIVEFSPLPTETSAVADMRLPAPTYLESWGYQVPQPGTALATLGAQQPVVRPLHDTRSPVDVLLAAAKGVGGAAAEALPWQNEVEYLRESAVQLRAQEGGSLLTADAEAFWTRWQQYGGWWSTRPDEAPADVRVPAGAEGDTSQPAGGEDGGQRAGAEGESLRLLPYASLLLAEGRHANLPWLQECPDPMTTVMWGSWAELNPRTADALGVETGDIVRLSSEWGEVEVPAYVYPGVGPDVIAVPLGQGHTSSGRYADGRGVNILSVLGPGEVEGGGELAWADTHVSVEKTGADVTLARLEGSEARVLPEGL